MLRVLQRVIELPELVIDSRQIGKRGGIPRVGLAVEFVGGNTFVELAAVGVIVGSDVELLTLAGAIAKLEGLLTVLLRQRSLAKVVVGGAERA